MLDIQIQKIKGLFKGNWAQLNLLSLLTPFLFAGCISWYLLSDQVSEAEWIGPDTFKAILENIAFYILVPACVFAYLRFCFERSLFSLWLLAIIGSLICREIHWAWTGAGVFALLALLMIVGFVFYDKLRPQISSTVFINLFTTAILCYFIASFLLDQNWARIPKEFHSEIRFRKTLEEFMEILGHAIMASIVFFSPSSIAEKKIRLRAK